MEKYIKFAFMTLFAATLLISCKESSTDKTTEKEVAVNFDEELALPDFKIATIQDSTEFNSSSINKDGIILIKYFSPDCDNCQEEAKTYVSKKDSLQNIRTMWISGEWAELSMVKEFAENYELQQLNPIVVGKEPDRFLVAHFGLSGVPFAAVYKDNQLLKAYQGALDFDELIAINKGEFILDTLNVESKEEEHTSH